MDILNALVVEHGVFNAMFDWMRSQAIANPVQYKILGPFMMASRLLETHAALEDELLFSALEPRLGTGGSVEGILQRSEHKRLEEMVRDGIFHSPTSPDYALSAIDFARAHFRGEEEVLFPLARKMLTPSHLEQLGACLLEFRGLPQGKGANGGIPIIRGIS